MKIKHHVSVLGIFLGFAHLALALWVYSQPYEGSWGYAPMVAVDFPVSFLFAVISRVFDLDSSWSLFFVFGSVWWYLIGLWLARLFRKQT